METTEQTTIDKRCEELLRGKKDIFEIQTILAHEVIKRNPKAVMLWQRIYDEQPSCKNIRDAQYYAVMKQKYITVYKLCLESIDKGIIE